MTVIDRKQNDYLQLVRALAKGAFWGLAWGASLRAWMVVLALEFGDDPQFTWDGTFLVILLPSALMGALLNGARFSLKHGKQHWRGTAIAPLLLIIGPLLFIEDFLPTLISTGLGGGAIGVALIGLLGGYGLSRRRTGWLKRLAGLLALLLIGATGYSVFFSDQTRLGLPTARQAFGALFFVVLMVLLISAASIPYREWQDTESGCPDS